jgi:hypothetical protein
MSSTKKTLLILSTMTFAAAFAVVGTFTAFVKLAETQFIPGEEVYLRDIYVVIDQTLSMQLGQRKEAKDILRDEVIRSLGLGDRVFCYRISSDFRESSDRVFASKRHQPKVPDNLAGADPEALPAELVSSLIQRWQSFSLERDAWIQHLETLHPPRGNYSDYTGTLDEISRRISDAGDPNLAQEKWLLVIGDLKQEPVPGNPPAAGRHEKRAFSGVNIYMVYPGGIHSAAQQKEIETFWTKYFSTRGASRVNFMSFDGFTGRFPENATPREEMLRKYTARE